MARLAACEITIVCPTLFDFKPNDFGRCKQCRCKRQGRLAAAWDRH
jgi:hypothetical protein